MRLPQGYGSVYKLKGKRRKPWTAVKTVGWELVDGKAKQKRVTLGYYATKKEGLQALAESKGITEACTFEEVYKRWSAQAYPKLSVTFHYENAFKYLKPLWAKKFADLKTLELETVVLSLPNITAQKTSKLLLNQMYQYAVKYDLCESNLAKRFSVPNEPPKINRTAFTDEEIKRLWEADDTEYILIQIYSGWRSAELVTFTDDGTYMYGGVKTASSKNRVVPIHPIIKDLVANRKPMTYSHYHWLFNKKMEELNMTHTTHDCRVTFATKCHLYGVDLLAEQKMLGHKINNITEGVYTKLTNEYLLEQIKLIC